VSERRQLLAVTLAALAIWAWIAVPLLAGSRTLFLRDVFSVHFPLKAYGAEQLAEGRIPAFFDRWGLGAPFRGNPQALAFYPGNVFYLVLPFWIAFNLHYVLHWLIAFFAMRSLARALGQSDAGRTVAALAYAGGGVVLSALSFYNLLVVLAWWPAVMAAAVRGGRRGIAWGGLACGLALLGGEPISLAVAGVPLLWAAWEAHGKRRGTAIVAAMAAAGALVALPQIVATGRILPFTFRAAHGMEASQAAAYALHPLRLLELIVPLPWGWPARAGAEGWWSLRVVPRPPFFSSLYLGVVGAGLALCAVRWRRGWAAIAAGSLLLAWLGGEAGEALSGLTAGLFRYPEKFLVAFALAAALLAGWGVERALAAPRRRGWWIAAALCALGGSLVGVLRALVAPRAGAFTRLASVQGTRWTLYLLAAAALLGGAAWCLRRKSAAGLVALQLAALVQLWPLVPRVETAPLKAPAAWRALLPERAAVHSTAWSSPRWLPIGPGPRTLAELAAALDPAPGLLSGLSYPLAPDFEGLASPLHVLLQRNLAGLPWPARIRWMQVTGVDHAVLFSAPPSEDLELVERRPESGYEARLYRVRDATPEAFWPRAVRVAANPVEALGAVPELASAVSEAVVARPLEQSAEGDVSLESRAPDRLALRVRSGGGMAVVRRAFHPLWRARLDGREAAVEPVDLVLLGVAVPAGEHRLELSVSAWPETLAGVMAILSAAVLFFVGWRRKPEMAS
jgi:hypothetical protein